MSSSPGVSGPCCRKLSGPHSAAPKSWARTSKPTRRARNRPNFRHHSAVSARLNLALLALIALVGCARPAATQPPTPTPLAPSVTASPTPIELSTPTPLLTTSPLITLAPTASPTLMPTATPFPGATPFEGCINGWTSPHPASDEYVEGLAILSGYMGVTSPWVVDEMRYFVGPDSPGVIEPRFENVERWYVRGSLESDPSFRGRFLLEKRTDQI